MSQIANLSKIEKSVCESSCSRANLSMEDDIFTNYLEPQGNEIFDTRRFNLKKRNSQILNTATPKVQRSSTPGCKKISISSRTNSAKNISKCFYRICPSIQGSKGILSKRVENLEKKQEQWKERASVWEKERRSYQKAIENISSDPTRYYKNQLEVWKSSKFLNKISESTKIDPMQEVKNLFDWMNSQPESTPFKSIKLSFPNIAAKLEALDNYVNSLHFPSENNEITVVLKDLSEKNNHLAESLQEIEQELKSKIQALQQLQEGIEDLRIRLKNKDIETNELKEENNRLNLQINEMKNADKKSDMRKIIELTSEIEQKEYEIIIKNTENSRLVQSLDQMQKANEMYMHTIDELKEKVKNLRIECYMKNENCEEQFNKTLDKETQTLTLPKHKKRPSAVSRMQRTNEFIAYTSCMASAIEALLIE
ncbi:hypothetical protein SteCoe_37765 [Stentor coeruleus]|uniref:Uncharacterized protein n=1 Tax=Stentor coeruleus TaxID=5963 RepID=A0A1R2AME6_9CILI|nr:hypothetical protein SteCoe_37765 [Stentor coeruleus]